MPSEAHEGIRFIDLEIINPPINTLQPLENQWDISEMVGGGVALKDLPLDDHQVALFDIENSREIDDNFFGGADAGELHFVVTGVVGVCS